MRILVVTTFFPNSVNPHRAVFVKNLVNAMHKNAEMSVVAPVPYAPPFPKRARWMALRRIPLREKINEIDIEHPRFIVLPKIEWFTGASYFLGVVKMLSDKLRKLRPDVIHVHCGYPDSVGVALAARLLGIPYVVTLHGSDINVYATYRLLRPQIRWALKGASGVIAVSSVIAGRVQTLTHDRVSHLVTIPCAGFDPRIFFERSLAESRLAVAVQASVRVIVFVGHLVPVKGIEFLIDAWALLLNRNAAMVARLIIIGEGSSRELLEQRANQLGAVANITFTGVLSQKEVSTWIAASDLLCLPSLNEGTPNVVVEALATGIPVVASRVGGIPALIKDGENGKLVPSCDVLALADAIEEVLSRQWSRSAIRSSVAHLTWDALAEKNIIFIESVITK